MNTTGIISSAPIYPACLRRRGESDFCQRLLTAAEALKSGYNGTTFSLFPGEEALVLAAKASTLADFAQQVISGQPVQPERTRPYRSLETFGTAYSGRGIPAIAAFRAP